MATINNTIYAQLPSPPLSPLCNNYKIEKCECSEDKLKDAPITLSSPVEDTLKLSDEDILRNKYMEMMEDGIKMNENDEMAPYPYVIKKLHSFGSKIINKKTMDAIPLRVYETGLDKFEDFWVHPMFLSLQSFQFFKLFEEIKANQEQGIIEIEVPSLKTFAVVLYYLYSGDSNKLLEIAKLDNSLCKGIMENIECLEINMTTF